MKEFIAARRVWVDMGTVERQRLPELFSITDDLSMAPFRDLPIEMQARLQTKANEETPNPRPPSPLRKSAACPCKGTRLPQKVFNDIPGIPYNTDMMPSPSEIVNLLVRYRFRYRDEAQLQEGIARVLI